MNKDKATVLVADDECAIADMLAMILRKSGYEAHTIYSGVEQVELAKSLHPDFVISDVVKPDVDGVDAAIEIKKTAPSCKILLCTGAKATLQLMEAGRARFGRFADLILPKPVHPKVILDWLRNGGNPCPADPVEEFRRLADIQPPDLENATLQKKAESEHLTLPPDVETRVVILQKKAESEDVTLPDDVSWFIANNIRSNVRELEGAVIRLIAFGSLTGTEINLSVAQQVLKKFIAQQRRKVTIKAIQKPV